MKSKIYLAAVALSAIALFGGCAKDGATGLQGPQGPAGADGTNANITGTLPINVNWAYNSGTYTYTDTLVDADITQDIVNTGSVQVFALYNGVEWWILPDVNGKSVTTYGYSVGYVSLQCSDIDVNTTPTPPATVRVVIISSTARMAHPNVDWSNYAEVKAALHLKD